jgi:hypothetical protein
MVCVAFLAWHYAASLACGQAVSSESFVTRGYRGRDVLTVNAQLQVPPSSTFGKMRVVIEPTNKVSTSDRVLQVVFYVNFLGLSKDGAFAYRVPAVLAEGAKQVIVDIPHVQFDGQCTWDVGVYEENRDIEDQRVRQTNQESYQWNSSTQQQLFPLATLVDDTQLAAGSNVAVVDLAQALFRDEQLQLAVTTGYGGGIGGGTRAGLVAGNSSVVPVSQASGDWRDYLAYAAWVVSVDLLDQLAAINPAARSALRTYVASGGTLLIHDAATAEDLQRINQLLDEATASQWMRVVNGDSSGATEVAVGLHAIPLAASSDLTQGLLDNLLAEEVVLRSHLFGHVLVCKSSPAGVANKLAFLATHASNNFPSVVSAAQDGNWFWKNLIRAVGKPPVWTFCALVTLFGAILGPGLLFITGRIGRRSLMIFLVPVVSLVATTCILAYGVLHEGFGTHTRITSVQKINTEGKWGFAWSRQNYFSGLPPREGLTFSADTYVRPVQIKSNNWNASIDPREGIGSNILLGEQQTWQDWLRARQQQQLLVGHRLDSPVAPLSITSGDGDSMVVENLTAETIVLAIIRGSGSEYYLVEQLLAGSQVTCLPEARQTVGAKVARAAVDYRPVAPPELQDGGSLVNFGSRRSSRSSASTESNDVINLAFKNYMSEELRLPQFGYSLLTRDSSNVELPVDGTNNDSLHLIIGVQPW